MSTQSAISGIAAVATEESRECRVRMLAFDFEAKRDTEMDAVDLENAFDAGHFVWIDVDFGDVEQARAVLTRLSIIGAETIDDALSREPTTQSARYDDYLHLVVSGCRLQDRSTVGEVGRGTARPDLALDRVDCAIGARFMLTIHRGPVAFLERMRKGYRRDFERFAHTPSFLVYELWDQLVESYLEVQQAWEQRVETLQRELMGDPDDAVFARVAELGSDLLSFRKVVLPARAVLSDLGTRRSLFLSEITQGFLLNLVGTLEHVLQDLLVDRDILTESLNLYVSLVAHRTNQIMRKLTVVSVIFLPLTFLCGVYGMNFAHLPELSWHYGYALFWVASAMIVGSILWLSRRARLL